MGHGGWALDKPGDPDILLAEEGLSHSNAASLCWGLGTTVRPGKGPGIKGPTPHHFMEGKLRAKVGEGPAHRKILQCS